MPARTTLIIADDHPLFRAALGQAVVRCLPDAQIVEAGSVEALEAAADAHPDADLILLDLRMPGAQGLSELMELRIRHPAIPVAVVSALESATIARKSIACGASGFIPKSASIDEIGSMLRALLAGEIVAPEGLAQASVEDAAERKFARAVAALTPQQYRVLLLLARGYSNRAIAEDIDVVVATVKAHVTVILRKLGLERRTQAALLAQRLLATDAAVNADVVEGVDDDVDE
ncbi:MAG TPA: response regulator transcription factor [Casimicrobiaceae bacterium]|jgi:DNA-binding NarL/FixJ family response regulator|nr:response regulator transcription factor [Casimicrobiaceae bacterium]